MSKTVFAVLLCALSAFGCTSVESPVLLRWESRGGEEAVHRITIINRSADSLTAPWSLYYGSIAPVLRTYQGSPVVAEQLCGSHHRFRTADKCPSVAPGDSLVVIFGGRFVDLKSFYPEGCYFVRELPDGSETVPCDVELDFIPVHDREAEKRNVLYPTGDRIYVMNERLAGAEAPGDYDILPDFKSVRHTGGECRISSRFDVLADDGFENEAGILRERLAAFENGNCREVTTVYMDFPADGRDFGEEGYAMAFSSDSVLLTASAPHGMFNAVQSLMSVFAGHNPPFAIAAAEIEDAPDLRYRGLHFDVARNFTSKDNVMRLIELVSRYKINVLHLHLTDDEAWRIEIPGIEELTGVSSHRGHGKDESECLCPAYGSGWNAFDEASAGNGFYTCGDFIEILQYAARHHVKVIPEIDMPGHSRAAVKAMEARYRRYRDTDPDKAREYLMSDSLDTSVYRSPQDYHDNVMNIGMEGSYNFTRKVFDCLYDMYAAAGVPLEYVHVGGDELPRGAWTGSPEAYRFMAEKNLSDVHEMKDYYVRWLNDYLARKGVKLAGWQEIVMLPDGRHPDPATCMENVLAYSWNTIPGDGLDEIPYKLANAGYSVVLCNVTNLYFDLAYNRHHSEPGHNWGGYVDAVSSFNTLPYNIYNSIRNADGSLAAASVRCCKESLRESARANIAGVQGQMWAETFRSFSMVEYLLFPKLFGLAERGWNAEPEWGRVEDKALYDRALRQYYARIARVEMPLLAADGVHFRVSPPGLTVRDGLLYANTPEPGAVIRYTLDGSEPDMDSPVWTEAVDCGASVVRAKAYYCGLESVVSELYLQL